jgi:hypothetical protein
MIWPTMQGLISRTLGILQIAPLDSGCISDLLKHVLVKTRLLPLFPICAQGFSASFPTFSTAPVSQWEKS